MQLQLVLIACLVNFGSQTVQPHHQTVEDEIVVRDVSDTHGNFQNLFDSIAKSDAQKSGTYRDILTHDVERTREVSHSGAAVGLRRTASWSKVEERGKASSVMNPQVSSNTRAKRAFDAMKDKLWFTRNRNSDKRRNFYQKSDVGKYVVVAKRETKENNCSTEMKVLVVENREQIVHLFTLAGDTTLVVVYYWHNTCGPCKRMSPIFDEFPQKYPKVMFLKVNTKKCLDITASQKVQTVPAIAFYRGQVELSRLIGDEVMVRSEVEAKIQHYSR